MILLLILPFMVLLRGATYIHIHYGYPATMSLFGAIGFTAVLLLLYFTFFYGKLTGKIGSLNSLKRRALIAFLVVGIYSVHGILFLSTSNMKNPALKKEISSLHPILRLSLSTLIYLDKDLIITDASRVPEDYRKMGLPTKKASLHYKQAYSNYVHAVDLRTQGRSELKNRLVQAYFSLMGFSTLRHVGTADHLHVSLYSHDRPGSK